MGAGGLRSWTVGNLRNLRAIWAIVAGSWTVAQNQRRAPLRFFFSSRRRHTRSYGDWSSDVCSSDLIGKYGATVGKMACKIKVVTAEGGPVSYLRAFGRYFAKLLSAVTCLIGYIIAGFRSEERRVGKECRSRCVQCAAAVKMITDIAA